MICGTVVQRHKSINYYLFTISIIYFWEVKVKVQGQQRRDEKLQIVTAGPW